VTQEARPGGWRRLALVALAVVALDQAVKALVDGAIEPGERVEVLPFLDLVRVTNEGVAFGFLDGGSETAVLAITAAALALVHIWFARDPARPWSWLAIGLLAGGAIGNLIDRVFRDGVIDYIDLPAWPSFNLADVAITLGAGLLVLAAFGESGDEESGPAAESPRGAA
jgi:signal peptidase II